MGDNDTQSELLRSHHWRMSRRLDQDRANENKGRGIDVVLLMGLLEMRKLEQVRRAIREANILDEKSPTLKCSESTRDPFTPDFCQSHLTGTVGLLHEQVFTLARHCSRWDDLAARRWKTPWALARVARSVNGVDAGKSIAKPTLLPMWRNIRGVRGHRDPRISYVRELQANMP